jgi:CarboxypepD_reg-like domain
LPLARTSRFFARSAGWLTAAVLLLMWLTAAPEARAQGARRVVQFTGIVTQGDSLFGVAGAAVYVPKVARGTITNEFGYFSLPVLAGDSLIVRALGFRSRLIVIPQEYQKEGYSAIIRMEEDATMLPEVRVFPYTTEKLFKEAFLALKLPERALTAPEKNLNEETLRRIYQTMPSSAAANARSTFDQQQQAVLRRNQIPTLSLLDPFAWARFVKDVKSGSLKRVKPGDVEKNDVDHDK